MSEQPRETGPHEVSLAWLRSKPGLKWSSVEDDVIPAWIADMDYPAPEVVVAAIRREIETGDLGYPPWLEDTPLEDLFSRRMSQRHGWRPEPGRMRLFTDVLNALQAVLFLVTEPGDAVACHAPTYPPFLDTFRRMGIQVRPIRFERTVTSWRFDPDEAREAVEGAKVLLVVNPHNPTGRVLTREELECLAGAALETGAVIVSDEVHADLVYPGRTHLPTAALAPDVARSTVTLTSATKAFNLAGIRCALAHLGHRGIGKALGSLPDHLFGVVGNLGVVATEAAWREGAPWLEATLSRLDGNRRRLSETLNRLLPEVGYVPPEATYLAWLDFRRLPVGPDPARVLLERGRVRLSPGPDFGSAGEGFARLNFATSGPLLDAALIRMASALEGSGDGPAGG